MPSNSRPSPPPSPPLGSLPSDELLRELDAMLAEVDRRAANYVEMGAGNLAALDEGLLFATKAEELIYRRRRSWLCGGLDDLLDRLKRMSLEQTLVAEEVA
ncbi:MAG: hypothetical protein KJ051_10545 [Thermoleophilia bacterium]|nr:hypothetical protein [Thermoleophilia bacterium]